MPRATRQSTWVFKIRGRVVEQESGVPIPDVFVKAFDKDLLFDDVLGSDVTDARGAFEIVTELEDFREFFDKRPDVYFKVYAADRRTLLHTTRDAVRWNVGRVSDAKVEIPWDKLHPPEKAALVLAGEDGRRAEDVEVGDSLTLQARGLRPRRAYDVTVSEGGRDLFTSRVMTTLRGEIRSFTLWPQMGLDDPTREGRLTVDEAIERWQGRTLQVSIGLQKKRVAGGSIRIAKSFDRPMALSTDATGRIRNGFEVGTQPVFVAIRGMRTEDGARVFLVPRQHNWGVGDAFQPATLANGRPAVRDVELAAGGRQTLVELAGAEDVLPGAYDFIVRPLRYGAEDNDALRLLPRDVVGSRRITGLVVREKFLQAKPVLGGCVNKIPMSGRVVSGAPYFRFTDTFALGEDVYAALDPGIVDPGNIGKMCALYVIPSKSAAQWNADNSLAHLAALGGNANVQKLKVQSDCVNHNDVLLWDNASQVGEYDIVADFGNNKANAMDFQEDAKYNTPLDIIDGYFVAGFRVVKDPGTMSDDAISNVGAWDYVEADVDAMGMTGTVTVEDENTSYHAPGAFSVVNRDVRLKAHVRFPADAPGVTDPAQISAAQPSYPLVVIVHGNGHDYTSYDFLLEHFARNGFVAASIDLRYVSGGGVTHGMKALGRARVLFQHIPVLQARFGAKLQNNIGIMGHSRGGEGVLKAARLNQQEGLGLGINAVVSLAPTDQYGSEVLSGAWAKPFLVLYGARDGDINGDIWTSGYTVPQTGFALYDRAGGAVKSMAFVHKATHNGFVTTNYDAEAADVPDLLAPADQQKVTKAYMNAFFRRHLRSETEWEGVFQGEWTPPSVSATGLELYTQYRGTSGKTLDDFEAPAPDWTQSSLGGAVTHDATLPADPAEGKLHDHASAPGLDPKSPHDTKGLKVRWDQVNDRLVYTIPPQHKDVTAYTHLSFRIGQKVDSPDNPANQPQNLRVVLKDTSNNERAIRVSAFAKIPFPDMRADASVRKSAMSTIRIPLSAYTIVCAGQVQVDLKKLASLAFRFSEKPTGEVEIDEIEFTQ